MPRLILLAPCERPLVGADNSLSLINIMHSIVAAHSPESLDESTKATMRSEWHIVTMWQQEPGDGEKGVRFEARILLTAPDGTVLIRAINEFDMPKPYHRTMTKLPGFPIFKVDGEYVISVEVRKTTDEEWVAKGSYPLKVTFRQTPEPTPSVPKSQTH